ncbi:MAG TPA: TIR domain-containing protein [Solirubrobacterales bacterium]|nr:TIR domain-containing protein [Solirubrobacterales bacterium]
MEAPPGWKQRLKLRGHEGPIGRLAWSPDGSLLATPGLDGLLIVWDAVTGKPMRAIRHGGPVTCTAFSPDSRRLACGFELPIGPDVAPGYVSPEEFGDDPLPSELDELFGDYDAATEWSVEEDLDMPSGAAISMGIADIESGEWVASFSAGQIRAPIVDLVWPGDGRAILTASQDGRATWQTRTGQLLKLNDNGSKTSIDIAPDQATSAAVGPISWERIGADDGALLQRGWIYSSEDGYWVEGDDHYTEVACGSKDLALGISTGTIQIVRADGQERYLEGHTRAITSLSFSADERLLSSKSLDGTVRLWDCSTWEALSVLREPARGQSSNAGIAFSPSGHTLATLGPAGKVAQIWDLDLPTIATRREIAPTVHYSNAKVVLLGDSGVGKTGLGLVLAGEEFRPTESSHRRNVWLLESQDFEGEQPQRRETYLWDLAGQPGYRLLHQLHLADAAVAIVLFDAKSESDPFAGVRHWVRALRQAERQGRVGSPRLLVAARMDRGGPQVSDERLDEAVAELGFERYLETSAKGGRGIEELQDLISSLIDWEAMPKVSSTGLFDSIKSFLVAERDRDRLLVNARDLRDAYAGIQDGKVDANDLVEEFDTCIGRVAARGLIRRLSFGGLVLLRPEVLDAYAASLTMAAREQPDGMGSISEEAARKGEFPIPEEERLADSELERLLLTATVEEVLRHEVALREHSDHGPYLVFPTQSRREAPNLTGAHRTWLSIQFEGQVQTVYATLVVRLAHSGLFIREENFRNATTFKIDGAVLGVSIEEVKEGAGLLRLFSSGEVDNRASGWFADYVVAHVRRRAVEDSVQVDDAVRCSDCGLEFPSEILRAVRARGRTETTCPVCDSTVQVGLPPEGDVNELVVKKMDDQADLERVRAAATAALHGKEEVGEFDVFLAHNSGDKEVVKRIAENLRSYGVNPSIDDEQVPPGRWFQDYIERAIGMVSSAAIIIGREGLGPWEAVELKSFIAECVENGLPVIPVLLPDGEIPDELKFLKQLSWVQFEESVDDEPALQRLLWGITGERQVVHKSFTSG